MSGKRVQYPSLQEPVLTPIQAQDFFVSNWHQPLSEPVRTKKFMRAELQSAFEMDPFPITAPEDITSDKWYRPLSEPVRVKEPLRIHPSYWMDQEAKRELDILRFFSPLSEPARPKKPLPIGAIPSLELDPFPRPPSPAIPDKWYQPLSEPVRVPKARKYATVLEATSGYIFRQICFSIDLQVEANLDDVVIRTTTPGYFNSLDYQRAGDLGGASTGFLGVMRFDGVTIPPGSTIIAATLKQTARSTQSGTVCRTRIDCEVADDAAQIVNFVDYAGRSWTSGVAWNVPALTVDDEFISPDFSADLQTVIDGGGWGSGNAVNVRWGDSGELSDDSAYREGKSHDLAPTEAAILQIEFCLPDAGIPFDPTGNMAWFNPLSEPVRVSKHVPIESFRHWIIDSLQLTLPERTQIDKWYRSLSEPVRTKKLLPIGAVPSIELDPFPRPPLVGIDLLRWLRPLSEPVQEHDKSHASLMPSWWIDRLQLTLPERTQLDKWYNPLSEPVRSKKPLPLGAVPSLEFDPFPLPFIPGIDLLRWFRPLSEPVRERDTTHASRMPAWWIDRLQLTLPERTQLDKWFAPLSEPVRTKKPLPIGAVPFYWMDQIAKLEPDRLRWFAPWSEPVRVGKPLPIGAYPVLSISRFLIVPAEITSMDKWYRPLSEPVRVKEPLPIGAYPAKWDDVDLLTRPEETLISKWYSPLSLPPGIFVKKRSAAALIASGLYFQSPPVFISIGQVCGEFVLFSAVDGSHSLLVAVDGSFDLGDC